MKVLLTTPPSMPHTLHPMYTFMRTRAAVVDMAAGFQAKKKDALMCLIGDEDTVTGFLLAGIGEIDAKNNSNFLVVTGSECPSYYLPEQFQLTCRYWQ